jgi:hypothetical protein
MTVRLSRPSSRAARLGALTWCFASVVDPARAQIVRDLPPALQVAADQFSEIAAIRELNDGRVLVADRRERRFLVLDREGRSTAQLGRSGSGPDEYRSASGIQPLSGDTSLLLDGTLRRWSLLDGTEFAAASSHLRDLAVANGTMLLGADANGRVLVARGVRFSAEMRRLPGVGQVDAAETADSLALLLIGLHDRRVDTVVQLRGRFRGVRMVDRVVRGVRIRYYLANPLGVEEQGRLFADGWIAVAWQAPYRVDWRRPDGQWIRGVPLPFHPVRVDDREKQFAIQRVWRGAEGVDWQSSAFPNWPEFLPPFLNEALLSAPDGRLLVQRTASAMSPHMMYDVVDRRGRLSFTVRLLRSERLVGSGNRGVYVAARSNDGLESLRLHPWFRD